MPFMIGLSPIRRTIKYLESCKIIFRENVRIFSISYKWSTDHNLGASEFVYWHLAQIQYNNPSVQVIKLRDLTPTPFIKIYLEDDEPILIDLDCRARKEIYNLLSSLSSITKTEEELENEKLIKGKTNNPTYFGTGCKRHCLCEIHGQVPCPSLVPVPRDWRGLRKKETFIIPPHIKLWGLQQSQLQNKT